MKLGVKEWTVNFCPQVLNALRQLADLAYDYFNQQTRSGTPVAGVLDRPADFIGISAEVWLS
jgi:hypothetical protein